MPSTLQHVASCLFVFLISSTTALPTHDNVEQASASDVGNQRCTSHNVCRPNEFCSKVEPSGIYPWTKSSQNFSYGYCTLCSQGCLEDQMFPAQNIFTETCREVCPIEHECDTHADCPEEGQWCSRDHKCHRCSSECGSYNRIYDVTSAGTSIDGSCPETCCDWGFGNDSEDMLSEDNLHVYIGACDASLSFHAGILVLQEEDHNSTWGDASGNVGDDRIEEESILDPEHFWVQEKDQNGTTSLTHCFVMEHYFDEGYPRKVVEVDCSAAIGVACREEATTPSIQGIPRQVGRGVAGAPQNANVPLESPKTDEWTMRRTTLVALLVETAENTTATETSEMVAFVGDPFELESDPDLCASSGGVNDRWSSSWVDNNNLTWVAMLILFICLLTPLLAKYGKKEEERTPEGIVIPKAVPVVVPSGSTVESTQRTEDSEASAVLASSSLEECSTEAPGTREIQGRAWLFWGSLWSGEPPLRDDPADEAEEEEEDQDFV